MRTSWEPSALAAEMATASFWIAVGAACVGLLAIVIALTSTRRRAVRTALPGEAQHYAYVAELLKHSDDEASKLRAALAQTEAERRQLVRFRELRSTLDLDRLSTEALEAIGELEGVDATVIVVRRDGAPPIVSSQGLAPLAVERVHASLADLAKLAGITMLELAYTYENEHAGELAGGYVVPLRPPSGETIGALAVFCRPGTSAPSQEVLAELRALADVIAATAAAALEFEAMRESAMRDPLTGLYNRRFFHEELERQVIRAQRYRRLVTIVMLDVDDFKRVNLELGHLDADAVLAEVGARLGASVRGADSASRIGGDEFGVILPEAGMRDAQHMYNRLTLSLATAPSLTRVAVTLSAGIGEFERGDDAGSLFRRSEAAMRQAKGSGKAQLVIAESLESSSVVRERLDR
jgi:diguanylate cyclase (GGDEF)-like protein